MSSAIVTEKQLLADLTRVAKQVEGRLTERMYAERGKYGVTTYRRRFGSWNAAKQAADLEPIETESIPENDLIEDLQRVDRQVEAQLTERKYAKRGEYSVSTYRRQFGSWSAAKRRAGIVPTPPEDLQADLERVAADVEPTYVTSEIYDERGDYRLSTLPDDEEFWSNAFEQIGIQITPLYHKFVSETQRTN